MAQHAAPLRRVFDERFEDPRSTRGDRFAWDWWHVPGQYTALRTPAWTYFPAGLYRRFHRALVEWGRATLGCHDISPPWLSCYVDGCRQELHGDLPHGPFAFVFSLTRWRGRVFSGGETILLRDEVLSHWSDFRSVRGVERDDIEHAVAPRFGQLTVFDPRIPHGVREVRGTKDPREGRLVIHGWFVQPRPFIRGPLRVSSLAPRISDLVGSLGGWLDGLPLAGLLSLRLDVANGTTKKVTVLADTTRVVPELEADRRRVVRRIVSSVRAWAFPLTGPSQVTLPLVFER